MIYVEMSRDKRYSQMSSFSYIYSFSDTNNKTKAEEKIFE